MTRLHQLLTRLNSDDPDEQRRAHDALEAWEDTDVTPVIEELRASGPDIRALAVWILHSCKHDGALPTLVQALHDPDEQVREWATTSLADMTSTETAMALLPLLSDADASVRRNAALVLGYSTDPQIYDALLPLAHDMVPDVRTSAVESLVRLNAVKAYAVLLELLGDGEDWARMRAVYLLSQMPQAMALVPLTNALGDRNAWVRTAAVNALSRYRVASTVDVLERPLRNDPSVMVRCACAMALGSIATNEAVTVLIAALIDSDQRVLATIEAALIRLGYHL